MFLQRFFEEARAVIQETDRWPRKCCQIEWEQEALYVACTWHAGYGGPWWTAEYRAQHLIVRGTEESAQCGADYCFSLCLKSCVSEMSCAFQVLGNTCKLNAFLYHQPLQHRQLPSN